MIAEIYAYDLYVVEIKESILTNYRKVSSNGLSD